VFSGMRLEGISLRTSFAPDHAARQPGPRAVPARGDSTWWTNAAEAMQDALVRNTCTSPHKPGSAETVVTGGGGFRMRS